MLKGESYIHGENYFYARWTMCFIAGLSSMTKREIVGIVVIDVKGLMMSCYGVTIHTTFLRFRYLKGTLDFGFWYLRGGYFTLTTYTDADSAGSVDDRKITSGGEFF
jgi:hypothetical protein